jgi:DNA-binding GntR family transcriptional regulator
MGASRVPVAALPAVGRRPLSDQVYDTLKRAILHGELLPATKLTESEIARNLNVSPTPVREAFRRLAAEGLVAIAPWRGVRVQSVSDRDMIDTYQCREVLEGLACRLAAARIDASGIAELKRLLATSRRARSASEVARCNTELHNIIFSCAANAKLTALLGLFHTVIQRDRSLTAYNAKRRGEIHAEHAAIIEALERRDAEAAEQAMRRHVHNGFAYRLRHPNGERSVRAAEFPLTGSRT